MERTKVTKRDEYACTNAPFVFFETIVVKVIWAGAAGCSVESGETFAS
jgi:hypothetical protein